MHELLERLEHFTAPRVLLVGDFMLDRYVYGDVERINPEAPVPVLKTVRTESRVGGAGNVAVALTALKATVCCVGVLGDDAQGHELRELLTAAGADTSGLVAAGGRPTAVKTRFVGLAQHRHAQQMLRVDNESLGPLPAAVLKSLEAAFAKNLASADIVVLEDYNKGVFENGLSGRIIALAAKAGKRVVMDPACIGDYRKYAGVTVVKPNRYEASLASGVQIVDDASLAAAATALAKTTAAQAIVITLDKEGAYLYADGKGQKISHQRPRSVYDISGAGDETLAVLAWALAGGCDYVQAVELANVAGGLEVERSGFVPIKRDELRDELRRMIGLRWGKVLGRAQLAVEVERRRRCGQEVVFTNGCFDLLHMGHVRYLRQARELGAYLVVAINADDSVARLKGPSRPVIKQNERAELLASLECVDYVTIFDEDTPEELLRLLRPEILVKGGSTPQVVGREIVEGYGGRVLTLDLVQGLSTSQIINRIVAGNGGR